MTWRQTIPIQTDKLLHYVCKLAATDITNNIQHTWMKEGMDGNDGYYMHDHDYKLVSIDT